MSESLRLIEFNINAGGIIVIVVVWLIGVYVGTQL